MMKKLILRIIVLLVVLVIAVFLVSLIFINPLAKAGIEKGGTYALGVDTTLKSVNVGIFRGRLTMDELTVNNPEGYKTPHLMKSGHWELEVKTGSLFTDTVEIPRFELDRLDMNIEQKSGGSNVSEVIKNAERLSSGEEEEKPSGKRVKIDKIIIRNVVANVQLLPMGGSASTVRVEVPEIVLNDVTPENSKGLLISEVAPRILVAVLGGVIQNGKGLIPDDMLKDLSGGVAGLASALGGDAEKMLGSVSEKMGKTVEEGAEKLKKETDKLKEETEKAFEGLFGN